MDLKDGSSTHANNEVAYTVTGAPANQGANR